MKKLMIIAGAALFAVSANAAMIDWSITRDAWGDTGVTFEGAKGGNVWAFLDSERTAVEAIIADTATGDAFDFSTISVKDAETFSNARGAASGTLTDASITAGNNYDVFFVAMSADSSKYLISDSVTGKAYDASSAASSVEVSWSENHMVPTTSSWAAVGGSTVPEPTSGLLLLLGVAGLALRRKHA